jgi:hypothetical protein
MKFTNNDIVPNEIKKKKYLEIKEIEEELKNCNKLTLKEKREYAKNEICTEKKEIKKIEEINEEYLRILKILTKDNSNKNALLYYLKFLKKYDEKISFEEKESFNEEINYYKILFPKDTLLSELYFKKEHNEYEEFLLLLNCINNYDLEQIKKKYSYDIEKIARLNQPIKFENNELYWYRNKALVLYSINKINQENIEMFNLMKYCIKKVLTDDLFNKNGKIFNDKTKITFILILIVIPQEIDICDYNINLLKAIDYKNNDEFIRVLKKEGFTTCDERKFIYENGNNVS